EDIVKQGKDGIGNAEATLAKAQAAREAAQRRLASEPVAAPVAISAAAPVATTGPENVTPIDFAKEIKPILDKNCLSCHKSTNAKSGLALETLESALEGGRRNGPAVIPKRGSESPLNLYLQGKKKPQMPFGSAPLSEAQIALLQKWIDQL